MVVPVDAEHHEAEDVGQEDRQQRAKRGEIVAVRDLELQDHDRDQDGDDAVAEGLEARLAHRDGPSSTALMNRSCDASVNAR